MTIEEYKANSFGALVTISGPIPQILIMLNNPTKYEYMAEKAMPTSNAKPCTLTTVFRPGLLKFSVEPDSVFCISLIDGYYFYKSELSVVTNKNGTAEIREVFVMYQNMTAFQDMKTFIPSRFYGVSVYDIIPDPIPYDGVDSAYNAYLKKKQDDATRLSLS